MPALPPKPQPPAPSEISVPLIYGRDAMGTEEQPWGNPHAPYSALPSETPSFVNGFMKEAAAGYEKEGVIVGDAPDDDRTDNALKARVEAYEQGDALNWLLEGSETQEQPEAKTTEAKPNGKAQLEGSMLGTVAAGISELPRQALGGVRDAAQSILEFGDWVESKAGLGGIQIFDEEGNIAPELLSGTSFAAKRKKGMKGPTLPDVGEPKTVIGGAVRPIARFLGPFGLAAKAMGGLRGTTALVGFGRASGAGAVADFLAFDPHEERLSDLLKQVPALANPVTEYLAADKEDSELEGRLKNAIEGLGIGTLAEGLFRAIKLYRSRRILAREGNAADLTAAAIRTATDEQMLREAGDLSLLGSADQNVPLVIDKKLTTAAAQTGDLGVPDDIVASALTRKGLEPLAGADGVYINFARINEPEDIQRIINDTAGAFKDDIDKARRGVRTNVETVLSADKIDAWDALVKRRPGQPLNAEQSVAARQLWATSADKLGKLAEIAADNPTPENLFQFRRMLATHHAIQKEVIAARSETARALQSWAIPVGGNLERMRDMESLLVRTGGPEAAAALARRVAVLAKTPNAAAGLSKFVEKSVSAKTLGSIQEYWINALLSGPKTHMVNMMSNTGVVGLSILERSVAARYGRLFSEEGVEIGEALAQIQGLRGGIWDAFRNAGKAMRTGQTGFGVNKIELPRERMISSGTWNIRSDSWAGRGVDALGSVVNVPGRMLQAEDEFFKTIGYRMELHAQAQRMVSRELREGTLAKGNVKTRFAEILNDPPEAIRLEAAATAAYQTFTNPPGKFTQWLMRSPVMSEFPVARFVLPFVNTPGNILKYTFERTPLAPLTAKYRNAIAKGGAEADLARTRMALGTMALMVSMDMAMNGHITGSGPPLKDTSERQNWMRQGNKPYSAKIGDRYFAFNRLDPMGYHMGIAADLSEYLLNAQGGDETAAEFQEMFAAAAFSIAENITSKSYMQGLAGFIEAIEDSDRYGAAWLDRFAGSFVPTGVKEVATFLDPTKRAVHDMISSVKSRTPGLSDDLPAKRDLWGRAIGYESGLGSIYDAVSPIYSSKYKPEPIDLAMEKDGWFLGMGGGDITIKGERVSFKNRPDTRQRYYQLRGATKPSEIEADWLEARYGDHTLLEVLNGMVTGQNDLSEVWQEAETSEGREKIARDVFNDFGRAAREQLLIEFPWIEEAALKKKAARGRLEPVE
jgi:hypothetical protein